jgi:hypothetical protein
VPLPASLPVHRSSGARPRPSRRVALLVLIAFGLAGLAAVATGAAALGSTAATVLVLATVSVMRAQWQAADLPEPPTVAVAASEAPAADNLAVQLRRLHDAHVEEVNLALDEGREDLARELAESYTDQALALLARA